MTEKIAEYFYFISGVFMTTFGIIGLFLPLMPTTCFLIGAVWAFSKSRPEFSQRIIEHPHFGPTVENWIKYKTIQRQTKRTINLSIVFGFSISFLLITPTLILTMGLFTVMLLLLLYINTRPEQAGSFREVKIPLDKILLSSH